MQQPPPQQQPWGYRPPTPPKPAPPWYRHPIGIMLIVTAALGLLLLLVDAFGGAGAPAPAPVTAAEPGATGPPPTSAATTVPASVADRIRAAAQDELAALGEVTAVQAEPGDRVTVSWEITEAATTGLTKNNARLGVLRIMSAVKQVEAGMGDDYRDVRLLGRFRLPGRTEPATVVSLRFAKSTVQRTDFIDTRYLEAYELADAATIQPAFRG
jgi:hypothetical protein